jgi:hypothetical protein
MSEPTPPRRRRSPYIESETVTDPAELARSLEQSRRFRQTALYKIGPDIGDAPPDLLAQYIVELESEEQKKFLDELVQRLPEDVLRGLSEVLQQRLGRGAA